MHDRAIKRYQPFCRDSLTCSVRDLEVAAWLRNWLNRGIVFLGELAELERPVPDRIRIAEARQTHVVGSTNWQIVDLVSTGVTDPGIGQLRDLRLALIALAVPDAAGCRDSDLAG